MRLMCVGGSATCPWSPGAARTAPPPATTVSRRSAEADPLDGGEAFGEDQGGSPGGQYMGPGGLAGRLGVAGQDRGGQLLVLGPRGGGAGLGALPVDPLEPAVQRLQEPGEQPVARQRAA